MQSVLKDVHARRNAPKDWIMQQDDERDEIQGVGITPKKNAVSTPDVPNSGTFWGKTDA